MNGTLQDQNVLPWWLPRYGRGYVLLLSQQNSVDTYSVFQSVEVLGFRVAYRHGMPVLCDDRRRILVLGLSTTDKVRVDDFLIVVGRAEVEVLVDEAKFQLSHDGLEHLQYPV